MPVRLLIAANSAWNIVNFRAGLVRELNRAGYEIIVIGPPDPAYDARLSSLGVEQVAVDIDRSGLNPLADARLFMDYLKEMRRLRPAAFLSFTVKPNIYGCLAARLLGVPAIANVSGLGTAFARRGWLRRLTAGLYRVALKRANVFFQNLDDLREFVEDGIVVNENAMLLPGSGVDLGRFVPVSLPPHGPIFLLVARLLADKGVREFMAAAREVQHEYPATRFQLLGPIDEGNPTSITRAELQSWIADGTIEYLGVTDDVREALSRATVVVLPSYYREGVPRSLLEGAAMARPLIATDAPGCRDLVVGQAGGVSCIPRDAGSLAAAMRQLVQMNPAERTSMGMAARRLVEECYSEERVIAAYLHTLEEIVGPRGEVA